MSQVAVHRYHQPRKPSHEKNNSPGKSRVIIVMSRNFLDRFTLNISRLEPREEGIHFRPLRAMPQMGPADASHGHAAIFRTQLKPDEPPFEGEGDDAHRATSHERIEDSAWDRVGGIAFTGGMPAEIRR